MPRYIHTKQKTYTAQEIKDKLVSKNIKVRSKTLDGSPHTSFAKRQEYTDATTVAKRKSYVDFKHKPLPPDAVITDTISVLFTSSSSTQDALFKKSFLPPSTTRIEYQVAYDDKFNRIEEEGEAVLLFTGAKITPKHLVKDETYYIRGRIVHNKVASEWSSVLNYTPSKSISIQDPEVIIAGGVDKAYQDLAIKVKVGDFRTGLSSIHVTIYNSYYFQINTGVITITALGDLIYNIPSGLKLENGGYYVASARYTVVVGGITYTSNEKFVKFRVNTNNFNWTYTNFMPRLHDLPFRDTERVHHCMLPNDEIMLVGGSGGGNNLYRQISVAYNYKTDSIRMLASPPVMSLDTNMLLLDNGNVLYITGAIRGRSIAIDYKVDTYYIYYPGEDKWGPEQKFNLIDGTGTGLSLANTFVTQLQDGLVFIGSGYDYVNGTFTATSTTARLFNVDTGVLTLVPNNLPYPMIGNASTLLPDGDILFTSGATYSTAFALNAKELYRYRHIQQDFVLETSLPFVSFGGGMVTLMNGNVIMYTFRTTNLKEPAYESGDFTGLGYIYDPITKRYSNITETSLKGRNMDNPLIITDEGVVIGISSGEWEDGNLGIGILQP